MRPLSRFEIAPLIRGHWKGLTNGVENVTPDWTGRTILVGVPIVLGILAKSLDWQIAAPTALLAGMSLLAGALLTSFTHLSVLRMKVSDWTEHESDSRAAERAMLDETAAHLLLAALASVITAVVLVIGLNFREGEPEVVTGLWAAVGLALSSWVVLLFIVCLPRLYSAYVQINDVSDKLNGFVRHRSR